MTDRTLKRKETVRERKRRLGEPFKWKSSEEQVSVSAETNRVCIDFTKTIYCFSLSPQNARDIAALLMEKAYEAEGNDMQWISVPRLMVETMSQSHAILTKRQRVDMGAP